MAKLTGRSIVGVALAVLGSVGVAVAVPAPQEVTVTNFPETQAVAGTVGIDPEQNLVECQSVDGTVEVDFVEPTVLKPDGSIVRQFDASPFEAIRVLVSCEGLCTQGLLSIAALRTVGGVGIRFPLQESRDLNSFFSQEFTTPGGRIQLEVHNTSGSSTVTAGILVLGRAN